MQTSYALAYAAFFTDEDVGDKEEYYPYLIPPNIEKAEYHQMCNQLGEIPEDGLKDPCPCCDNLPKKTLNPFKQKGTTDKVSKFGAGYSLYLRMIVFTII